MSPGGGRSFATSLVAAWPASYAPAVVSDDQIRISVNGELQQLPPDSTVRELLARFEVDPRAVAVERNRQIVPKTDYDRVRLTDGDQLEIVTFVGGG